MERAVLEAIVFIAAILSIIWTVVSLLDRWVKRERIKRMFK